MTGGGLVLIDDHVVVACSVADALACLDGPQAITAWFGARRSGDQTLIRSPHGDLAIHRHHERWDAAGGHLVIGGSAGPLPIQAHLTVRAVIRPTADRAWNESTEVWVHVELGSTPQARRAGRIVSAVIGRGLEHLRLELDAGP